MSLTIRFTYIVLPLLLVGLPEISEYRQLAHETLSGTVSFDDFPAPGATVTLVDVETGIGRMTRSDSLGTYRFTNVDAGVYRVTAKYLDLPESSQEISIAISVFPHVQDLTFLSEGQSAAGAIGGFVTDTHKNKLKAVHMTIRQTRSYKLHNTGKSNVPPYELATDDTGKYRQDELDPGEYVVQAEATGFRRSTSKTLVLNMRSEVTRDFKLSKTSK